MGKTNLNERTALVSHLDWDSCAKHFRWANCPAGERTIPKTQRDGRMWVFARTLVPLRWLFESLADGQTVAAFCKQHNLSQQQVYDVIEFAYGETQDNRGRHQHTE